MQTNVPRILLAGTNSGALLALAESRGIPVERAALEKGR